jgi:hypothetical protein
MAHARKRPKRQVKGRYGEPTAWDGLAAVFVTLAHAEPGALTSTERKWLTALEAYYHSTR